MTASVRAVTIRGNLRILKAQAESGNLNVDDLGLTAADVSFVMSDSPFYGAARNRVRRVLDQVAKASIDMAGAPVFELSAEFYGAVVVTLVAPHNWMTACSWLGRLKTNDDLVSRSGIQTEGIDPAHLFAILCELNTDVTARDEILNARIAIAQRALPPGDGDTS